MIIITNREVSAASIAAAWPGASVECRYPGGNTEVTFTAASPVPEKTEAEIIAAQDAYDVVQGKDAIIAPILAQIAALETSTLRSLRDSARGSGGVPDGQGKTPKQRLDDIETEITALRATLVP